VRLTPSALTPEPVSPQIGLTPCEHILPSCSRVEAVVEAGHLLARVVLDELTCLRGEHAEGRRKSRRLYICIYIYTYIYVCMYIYVYIYIYTHTHTHIYIYECVCVCVCLEIYTEIHLTYIHKYMHLSICIYRQHIYISTHLEHRVLGRESKRFCTSLAYLYLYISLSIYLSMCMYVRTYMHIYLYIHLYIFT